VAVGMEQQKALIKSIMSTQIRDQLVDPKLMAFDYDDKGLVLGYVSRDPEAWRVQKVTIHDNALGQLAKQADLDRGQVVKWLTACAGMLRDKRLALACHVLNTHFHEGLYTDRRGKPAKFLHRLVDTQLRGSLSRSYNRKLGTVMMLRPFLERCAAFNAAPVDVTRTDVQASVKCALPVVFEPVPNEFVSFGVQYTNSDYGRGSLMLQGFMYRVASGTSMVMENALRKVHLGSIISESDIELSEETMTKESQTHISAVRDTVNTLFSEEYIESYLNMIRIAHDKKLSWTGLRAKLKEVLLKDELREMEHMLAMSKTRGIIDLPPIALDADGSPEANAWWAAAALGIIAVNTEDMEHKLKVENLAGSLFK